MTDRNPQHIGTLVNGIQPGLPQPHHIIQHDYRATQSVHYNTAEPIRLVQFNIERGYKLQQIILLLQQLMHSHTHIIISLQEIDIHCERTGWCDVGDIIASTLQLNYIFVCEFNELYSSHRTSINQGGGVHGNGILTTFDIQSYHIIKHIPLYDWNNSINGIQLNEPRTGERVSLRITIQHNNKLFNIYNTHSEIFCGVGDRLHVLADLFDDIREQLYSNNIQSCCILADLNTQAHGIARLSSKYCRDRFRITTLGYTEAEWLTQYILNYVPTVGIDNNNTDSTTVELINDSLIWEYGLNKKLVQRLRNPYLSDPYDIYNDVTLSLYHGLYQGKLDWMLLRYCHVINKYIYNHDYTASDHKLLCCDITLSDTNTYNPMKLTRKWPGILTCSTVPVIEHIPLVISGVVLYYIVTYLLYSYIL